MKQDQCAVSSMSSAQHPVLSCTSCLNFEHGGTRHGIARMDSPQSTRSSVCISLCEPLCSLWLKKASPSSLPFCDMKVKTKQRTCPTPKRRAERQQAMASMDKQPSQTKIHRDPKDPGRSPYSTRKRRRRLRRQWSSKPQAPNVTSGV